MFAYFSRKSSLKQSRNRRLNAFQAALSGVEALEDRLLLAAEWVHHKTVDGALPSGDEQEVLWNINRARSAAGAEGTRLATSTDQDIVDGINDNNVDLVVFQQEMNTFASLQPVAYDVRMRAIALTHSADSANLNNTTVLAQLIENNYGGISDNSSWGGTIFDSANSALHAHGRSVIDWDGVSSRAEILNSEYDVAGIAYVREDDPSNSIGPNIAVQAFASVDTDNLDDPTGHAEQYFVGTIWEDLNENGQFDFDEGIEGVTVAPDDGDWFAVTGVAGGYAFPVTGSPTSLSFSNAPVAIPAQDVTVNGQSVLVDVELGALNTLPDLTGNLSFDAPATGDAGSNVNLTYEIMNIGDAVASTPFESRIYLSNDDQFGPDDHQWLVHTITINSLDNTAAANVSDTIGVALPAAGSEFWDNGNTVYAFLDIDLGPAGSTNGAVDESDELNNRPRSTNSLAATNTGSTLANLSAGSVGATTVAAAAGATITVEYEVLNSGNAGAGASVLEIRLSEDSRLEPTDPILATVSLSAIASGATASGTVTVTLPPADDPFYIGDGNYSFIAKLDADNDVNESAAGELDNDVVSASPILITNTGFELPDLVATSFDIVSASPVNAGGTLSVAYTVSNNGEANAASSTARFWLSTDTVRQPDQDFAFSNELTLPAINAGSAISGSVVLGTPPPGSGFWTDLGNGDGQYFVIMIVDADGQVSETNDANNETASASTVNIVNTDPPIQTLTLDIDGNGTADATDVVIASRVFASSTDVNSDGLVPNTAARPDHASIMFHLTANNALTTMLDPDRDGDNDGIDLVLIFNYLIGSTNITGGLSLPAGITHESVTAFLDAFAPPSGGALPAAVDDSNEGGPVSGPLPTSAVVTHPTTDTSDDDDASTGTPVSTEASASAINAAVAGETTGDDTGLPATELLPVAITHPSFDPFADDDELTSGLMGL